MVNTALARNSFSLSELQRTNVELGERSQALQEDLARASSPAALAQSAKQLGMVPAGSLAYLRLADGTISGRASIARGAPAPLTPEQKAESEAAAAKKKAKKKAKAEADRVAAIARAEAEAQARAAEQARIKAVAKAKALKAKQAARDKAASQGRGETLLAPPQPKHAPSEGLTR